MTKAQIRKKIFELLKEISTNHKHHGLLIVYSDLNNVISRGTLPIGITIKTFKDFDAIGNINSNAVITLLKTIGKDGAILIDKKGTIYSPSVYLNVSLASVNQEEVDPEFCARHIAALATSGATKSFVFTLSEETNKVREFHKGKIQNEYPEKIQSAILKIIKKDLKESKVKIN